MEITKDTAYISRRNKLPQTYSYMDVEKLFEETFKELMEGVHDMFGTRPVEMKVFFHTPPRTHKGEQQLFVYAYVNPIGKPQGIQAAAAAGRCS